MSGVQHVGKISYFENPLSHYTEEEIQALKDEFGTLHLDIREDQVGFAEFNEFAEEGIDAHVLPVEVIDA